MFMTRFIPPRRTHFHSTPAEKNNRLSCGVKCGLVTEKSVITVFNICKLFATVIFAVACRLCYVFFVFMYKTHLLSLHCSDNKTHPRLNIILCNLWCHGGLGRLTWASE